MIAIVGLGNPGEKYQNTRHSIGFRVVERLADRLEASNWKKKDEALSAEAQNDQAILIKPQEFINLSGVTLHRVLRQRAIKLSDVWVIHDDADLPFGQIKIKQGGTSAGHHGVESIDQELGPEYWRIRFGVGRSEGELDKYVLSPFTPSQQEHLPKIIDQLTEKLVEYIQQGITSETINYA